jgi:hypothetical protein
MTESSSATLGGLAEGEVPAHRRGNAFKANAKQCAGCYSRPRSTAKVLVGLMAVRRKEELTNKEIIQNLSRSAERRRMIRECHPETS